MPEFGENLPKRSDLRNGNKPLGLPKLGSTSSKRNKKDLEENLNPLSLEDSNLNNSELDELEELRRQNFLLEEKQKARYLAEKELKDKESQKSFIKNNETFSKEQFSNLDEPISIEEFQNSPKQGFDNEKDSEEQDVFIDKKNKKVKPLGKKRKERRSKKDKEKIDDRKNVGKRITIISIIVIIFLVLIGGAGFYNAIFPPKSLTPDDVSEIIMSEVDTTRFPLEEGKGFAKDFIEAYLNVNSEVAKEVLGYYYTGELKDFAEAPNLKVSTDYNQNIIFGPTIYEAKGITDYSANYIVGSLVSYSSNKNANNPDSSDESLYKWVFFNVNVYYDKTKDSFAITPESPTLVPSTEVLVPTDVPSKKALGAGTVDQQLTNEISSVVVGFITAYAASSSSEHSALDQYIVANPDPELLKGLNGEFSFASEDPKESIQFLAYPTDIAGEVKVSVVIDWRNSVNNDPLNKINVDYRSTYVMTLNLQENGKYLVSKFAPEYYVSEKENG